MKKIEIIGNRKRVYTENTLPSKTDPSWKQDCDVNHIMKRFKKTGQISHLATRQGVYTDVSEIPDLLGAVTQVQKANEAFSLLPAHVRKRFNNNPVEMVNFLQDSTNDQEAIQLGLKISSPIENQSGASKTEGRASPEQKTQTETTQQQKQN